MKIIKYKKIRNKYRVYIDNDEVDLYENTILKYDLLLKKEIDSSLLEKIKEYNMHEEVYERALSYINKKMRSKKEIESYLKKNGNIYVKETINRLEELGLIDDDRYVKAYVIDKMNLTNDGPNKIKQNLINEKMDETIVEKYINEIDRDELYNKLNKLVDKKIPTIKNCSGNVLKYKLCQYFINLGYNKDMIENILDQKNLSSNNGEKEYIKLFNKYSKKYTGYELENIIRQKLYQKGFDINEIKKNINLD